MKNLPVIDQLPPGPLTPYVNTLPQWVSHREVAIALGYQLGGIERAEERFGVYQWATEFENVHTTWIYDEVPFEYDGVLFGGSGDNNKRIFLTQRIWLMNVSCVPSATFLLSLSLSHTHFTLFPEQLYQLHKCGGIDSDGFQAMKESFGRLTPMEAYSAGRSSRLRDVSVRALKLP
jgi:hypothetical protein